MIHVLLKGPIHNIIGEVIIRFAAEAFVFVVNVSHKGIFCLKLSYSGSSFIVQQTNAKS